MRLAGRFVPRRTSLFVAGFLVAAVLSGCETNPVKRVVVRADNGDTLYTGTARVYQQTFRTWIDTPRGEIEIRSGSIEIVDSSSAP